MDFTSLKYDAVFVVLVALNVCAAGFIYWLVAIRGRR